MPFGRRLVCFLFFCLSHIFFLWLVRAFLDLPHYNREAFWSCLFLLIDFYLCDRPEEMFGRELNLRNSLVFVDFWSCVRIENFFLLSYARPEEVFAREKKKKKNNNK